MITTIKKQIERMRPRCREDMITRCPHCGRELREPLSPHLLDEAIPREKALRDEVMLLPVVCDCPGAQADLARAEEEAELRERETRRARQQAIFSASGMPEAWRDRNLGAWNVQTDEQGIALHAAQSFLTAQPEERRSLFVAGDIGCGKTYLASCLARDMHRRGNYVRWARVGDILAEIRRSFNSREECDPLETYKTTACLVLDDLGKERPTEWAVEQLFSLINARYDAELPLIVTSNYSGADLVRRLTPATAGGEKGDPTTGQAIVDRLRAMCEIVLLTGKSQR